MNNNSCINLLSDTVTLPTEEMRKAMFEAVVGDDVMQADPTVIQLQNLAANMTGMEAALYVPSGTMGNLLALMCHCTPGEEVILEESSHIYYYEAGNICRVAGLIPRTIKGINGIIKPEDIKKCFRDENIHFARTRLICVENTHNSGGGTVMPLKTLKEIKKIAGDNNLKVHMDGARLFNAANALNVDVKEITEHVDSVMFCLSKGLSAPVGSMLCGSKAFIYDALRTRKMLGGGMRQAGVIAAAGLVALKSMTGRLKEDHETARILAEGLNTIDGIEVDMDTVQSNIIMIDLKGYQYSAPRLCELLAEKYNILCDDKNDTRIRMVTHRHISKEDVEFVVNTIKNL